MRDLYHQYFPEAMRPDDENAGRTHLALSNPQNHAPEELRLPGQTAPCWGDGLELMVSSVSVWPCQDQLSFHMLRTVRTALKTTES